MAAGMPGTGIGGLFYIMSALIAPFRVAWRRASGAPSLLKTALGLAGLAGAVMLGIWLTGWLLGLLVHAVGSSLLGPNPLGSPPAPNVVRKVSLLFALGTLAAVLGAVQVARLLLYRRQLPASGLLMVLCVLLPASTLPAQAPPLGTRADSLYGAGDRAGAERAYAAIVASDPGNSHAIFRLGQLTGDRTLSLRLYRRYVALEPSDAWGHLALGDALARRGDLGEAVRQYDAASGLAPGERDVAIGKARVLAHAGHIEAAIAGYAGWLESHPDDAEAWRETGRLRLRSGRPRAAVHAFERSLSLQPNPATEDRLRAARAESGLGIESRAEGSRDSDANHIWRLGLGADLSPVDGMRIGASAGRSRVEDPASAAQVDGAALELSARPGSFLRLDGRVGMARLETMGGAIPSYFTATGRARLRWRSPGSGPALEASVTRDALDASPLLVTNHVVRSELGGLVDLPAGPFRLRGLGRVARIEAGAERNRRTRLGGALALPVFATFEVSAQYHRLSYAEATTKGYFAPRLGETLEAAAYLEAGDGRPFTLELEVGAGTQRVTNQAAAPGAWRRALRLYGYLTARLGPASQLRLEVEGYDAALSPEGVSTVANGWRYGSAALSLRWSLP